MKILLIIWNFIKKFKNYITILIFFIPYIIKNSYKTHRNNKYQKSLYKIRKSRDGETLEKKRKRYNKKR